MFDIRSMFQKFLAIPDRFIDNCVQKAQKAEPLTVEEYELLCAFIDEEAHRRFTRVVQYIRQFAESTAKPAWKTGSQNIKFLPVAATNAWADLKDYLRPDHLLNEHTRAKVLTLLGLMKQENGRELLNY